MLRKLLAVLLGLVVLAIVAGIVFVASRQNLRFDAPYPEVAASTDSTRLERGRYIVRHVANCGECHGDISQRPAATAGAEVALIGGYHWDIPPGTFYAPNITPDPATGIGRVADRDIARALRYGVGSDGRALLPFMEFQGLSDEDLAAVVSYLRTQPAVNHAVPAHRYNVLGNVVKATILAHPVGPTQTPPTLSPRGATIENGRYLVESVALCWACHTQRDPKTGQLTGPRFGGATGFVEVSDPGRVWAPPNITSDPATGRLAPLSEADFVHRFRVGRVMPGSPMPWQGYQKMTDDDLRAMYLYLKSLPPVTRDVGPPVAKAK